MKGGQLSRRDLIKKCKVNNPDNPNKSVCATAVCKALCVQNATKYLHTMDDIDKAIHTKFNTTDVSDQHFWKCISHIRRNLCPSEKTLGWVVFVFMDFINFPHNGHFMFLNKEGKTIVDTSNHVGFDNRKVISIKEVSKK